VSAPCRLYDGSMRWVIALVVVASLGSPARADAMIEIVAAQVRGARTARDVIGGRAIAGALATCVAGDPHPASAPFWLAFDARGVVREVHAGGPRRSCVEKALSKGRVARVARAGVVAGHVAFGGSPPPETQVYDDDQLADSPTQWLVEAVRIDVSGANPVDVANTLGPVAAKLRACAAKRPATRKPTSLLAWIELDRGRSRVVASAGSDDPRLDRCLRTTLSGVAGTSGTWWAWIELEVSQLHVRPVPGDPADGLRSRRAP